jgi:hypothetical protein
MRAIAFFLTCAIIPLSINAGRVEQITLDLERPARPFALTVTEATDVTVRANLLSAGAEFDPTGWTGLLWIGDRDGNGGMTLTNGTAVHGRMTWELAAASTPTNGRYDAIVLGAQDGRIEEWGRGAAVVRLNPARTSLPAEWSYGDLSYVIATQALAIASAAATTQQVAEAAAAIPRDRITTIDGSQWIDATGGVWRVSYGGGYWTISILGTLYGSATNAYYEVRSAPFDFWAYDQAFWDGDAYFRWYPDGDPGHGHVYVEVQGVEDTHDYNYPTNDLADGVFEFYTSSTYTHILLAWSNDLASATTWTAWRGRATSRPTPQRRRWRPPSRLWPPHSRSRPPLRHLPYTQTAPTTRTA